MFSRKQLARLIIPLVIEQVLAVTIGMADTMMVASVGEAAVSGISLVDSINILLINVFSALATGGAVVASQYLGRREEKNARIAAKQLVYATLALSAGIMILSLVTRNGLLRLIFGQISDDVMQNAQIYFLLSALSYPFLAVYNSGAALFRSMGNSKVSMYTSALMNLVNVVGNAILIFGAHMGVAGAATATLVSRILGAVIMMLLLRNRELPIYIERMFHPEIHMGMIKNILRIGVPNGLENGMFQVGKILVQGLIATFGTAAIAANAVANNLACMAIIPGSAIGLAMITVVGQCVGANDFEQAKRYTLKLTGLTYVCMAALNLLILLSSSFLIGIYQLSPDTSRMAIELIVFHCFACAAIWPAAFTIPNGLRAANDVRFTMLTSIFSMWIFRIGFSYILGQWLNMGVLGVWVAMSIDWVFRAILFVVRLCRGKWMYRQIL